MFATHIVLNDTIAAGTSPEFWRHYGHFLLTCFIFKGECSGIRSICQLLSFKFADLAVAKVLAIGGPQLKAVVAKEAMLAFCAFDFNRFHSEVGDDFLTVRTEFPINFDPIFTQLFVYFIHFSSSKTCD